MVPIIIYSTQNNNTFYALSYGNYVGYSKVTKQEEINNGKTVTFFKNTIGLMHPLDEIPKTKDVADKSLRILFSDELAWYGNYISVWIENKIAKINLVPASQGGLSSCQAEHLMSVLTDTLTEYETIEKVELYDPTGNKIEF